MALHTGVPEERNGDYFGPPVNRVARLLSAGHGGQILLSPVTYGLVRDTLRHLEPGSELRDLGEHRLRDLRYSERIYQLVVPDLPAEFPPPRGEPVTAGGAASSPDEQQTPTPPSTPRPQEDTPKVQEEVRAAVSPPPREERYVRKRTIGSGGMAEVYLAHDNVLDRDVALKVLRSQYAVDERFVERFRREARHAALLSHSNIVAVHDRGETEDGSYYIVMEYMPGGTLKERIDKEGALPPAVATRLALQIAKALEAAHRRGVIHRDIKPQNVLLTEEGEAKVADFGIARAASSSTMTRTGDVLGTAQYISPEQALGQPASPQSDLYSLGVVLYEMLTGELPHDAETPMGIAMKHVSGQLRPPREVNPAVPEGINAVTVRLLARDVEERYQSATEVVEDLERVQRGESPAPVAQQQEASLVITPARPSTGPDLESRPPLPEPWEIGAPQVHPPPAPPAGATTGGRRRKVPLRPLAFVLIAAVVLVGAGVIAWLLVQSRYDLLEHNSGALSVEVPSEWDERVVVDSEGERGRNWSSLLGESAGPSLTAVDDLDAWRNGTVGHKGVYMVASRKLAQRYTAEELVALGPNDYSSSCEAGTPQDFDRAPYSGKILEWSNCGGDSNHTALTLSAAPEGRECVVVAQIGGYLQNDEENIRRILDTFEADCERIA
jgi:tRNA A-37 threonylcarbamoyl transferase component Bud32